VSGGGEPASRGGAATDGSEGESQEGGGGAFHTGHHPGQHPPGPAHGERAALVERLLLLRKEL